jgi:hypothetical protein
MPTRATIAVIAVIAGWIIGWPRSTCIRCSRHAVQLMGGVTPDSPFRRV